MKPLTHPRGLFNGRPVKGLPPFLCHIILWAGGLIFVFGTVTSAMRTLALAVPDTVTVNPMAVDAANDGRSIHLAGTLTSASPIGDPQFGVIGNAACLRRHEETRTGRSRARAGRTPNAMVDHWSPRQGGPILSPGFEINLGAFQVDTVALANVARFQPIRSTPALAEQVVATIPNYRAHAEGEWIVVESTLPLAAGEEFPAAFRVKFEQVPLGATTIVGRQTGQHVIPVAVEAGLHPSGEVIQNARDSASTFGWLMAILGGGLVFAGLHLLSQSRDLVRLYGRQYFTR